MDNEPTESCFELRFALALKEAAVSYANTGLYEMTHDANPIVSEILNYPNLYYCAGFAAHGLMHARIIGELMAEILRGSKPHLDISSFEIKRFGSESNFSKEGLII